MRILTIASQAKNVERKLMNANLLMMAIMKKGTFVINTKIGVKIKNVNICTLFYANLELIVIAN